MRVLLALLFPFLAFCENPLVLVTVAPHKHFVEQIAGPTVDVLLMVPAGASSHTYEPTVRQMITAEKGAIWFCIGEPFETRAVQALKSHHPDMKFVDLKEGLSLIHAQEGRCHCCPSSVDLHFWLSPKEASRQGATIAAALSQAFPQHRELYEKNLGSFQHNLEALDQELRAILAPCKGGSILVSHPAYGYFCRDYSLEQYAIEMEGKDPTPRQMTYLLEAMKAKGVKKIFIQRQYNNKAAGLVGECLGASLVTLDPYAEDYFTTMRDIAKAFCSP